MFVSGMARLDDIDGRPPSMVSVVQATGHLRMKVSGRKTMKKTPLQLQRAAPGVRVDLKYEDREVHAVWQQLLVVGRCVH
jgi:hypothetical protein